MAGFDDVDMNGVEPQDDYSPIPVGDYIAAITASEIKQTKDYTGKYIKLEVTILDGKYKNRKIWSNLNLWNANDQAVAIAKREMASIKIATNQPNATDTVAFHNKPVLITVGIKPAQDGYDAQNNIRGWKPVTKPAAQAQAAPQQVTASAKSQPWESVQQRPFVAPPAPDPAQPDIF